jgi:hypothetical protein
MIENYLMMIQLAGIHNGFRNKNHLNNIDIVGIDIVDIADIDIVDIGNIEHMKVAGEHTEYTEVVGEHMKAVGEHMKAVGEHTEYTEVAGNRQIAEVQQHW